MRVGNGLDTLQAIDRFWSEHGYSPSYRDLMSATMVQSTSTITYHLRQLRRRGLVTFEPALTRTIVITKAGRTALAKGAE